MHESVEFESFKNYLSKSKGSEHTCWLRGVFGESLFISEISFSIAFSSLTAICSRFLASTSVFALANFFSPFFFLSFFLKKSSKSAILIHWDLLLVVTHLVYTRRSTPSAKKPFQLEAGLLMPLGLPQQLAPPLPLRLHVTVMWRHWALRRLPIPWERIGSAAKCALVVGVQLAADTLPAYSMLMKWQHLFSEKVWKKCMVCLSSKDWKTITF